MLVNPGTHFIKANLVPTTPPGGIDVDRSGGWDIEDGPNFDVGTAEAKVKVGVDGSIYFE